MIKIRLIAVIANLNKLFLIIKRQLFKKSNTLFRQNTKEKRMITLLLPNGNIK